MSARLINPNLQSKSNIKSKRRRRKVKIRLSLIAKIHYGNLQSYGRSLKNNRKRRKKKGT